MQFCGPAEEFVMNRAEMLSALSEVLCSVEHTGSCPFREGQLCSKLGFCRIEEKTDEQLGYIFSPIDKCVYLEACAGSGKTEVLGMKAAYEMCRWRDQNSGIAVLTFTNDALATIHERISTFYKGPLSSNHFVGTFSSFIHGHIAQRFGYKFYRPQSEKKDNSFRIIESDASRYDNHWLQNYQLDFPTFKGVPIYANQVSYRSGAGGWYIEQGEKTISLVEHYMAGNSQQVSFLKKQAKACKRKFWAAGFATFEDMNLIARGCLSDKVICKYIAKRFPLIFVDECQDLSQNELHLLSLLMDAGTVVHYIGDLHQAIYSFKDACPTYFVSHIEKHRFETMRLSHNFRSTQSIVDVSRKIAAIAAPISGMAQSEFGGQDCFYIEYKDEQNALPIFRKLLDMHRIEVDRSVVLTRSSAAKARLRENTKYNYNKSPIISAIQLWQEHTPASQTHALCLLGQQLQKQLGFQGRANSFYFPPELCDNAVMWRLMLRDILKDLCANESIHHMENMTYSQWCTSNKSKIICILNQHLNSTIGQSLDTVATWIKSPKGAASNNIEKIPTHNTEDLRIETVHAIKGGTFDAVLFVSAPNSKGKTGYWENWLDPKEEASRIGYVACTRPRIMLCWAVSYLTDEQRHLIEKLGFIKYD